MRHGIPLLLVIGGLACTEAPIGPNGFQAGEVRASIEGYFVAEYSGDGDFLASPQKREGFDLSSRSVEQDNSRLQFHTLEGDVPSLGRHAITSPAEQASMHPRSFAAYFQRPVEGSGVEAFASFEGEVTISRSERELVEGTFHFQSYRYCLSFPVETPGAICRNPVDFDPDAPRITVTGSFRAIRGPLGPAIPQ